MTVDDCKARLHKEPENNKVRAKAMDTVKGAYTAQELAPMLGVTERAVLIRASRESWALQAAKALIDDCLREWAEGSNADLRTLVDHTFRVDKKGKLNTGAILGLRRLNITDERWQNAMQAISDSIKVMGSCVYVRFYERTEGGAYKLIPLDMAAV